MSRSTISRSVPDPPRSDDHAPRFTTTLVGLTSGLHLHLTDTKKEMRGIMIALWPPGSAPEDLTSDLVYRGLEDMADLGQIDLHAKDATVGRALAKAVDARGCSQAVQR